jgi:hypothetical protein
MTNVVEFEHSVIPAGMATDQELINEGRRIVNMRGRVLGDWYNKVKLNKSEARKSQAGENRPDHKKSAEQICKEADVSSKTAQGYGLVSTAFPTVESQRGFSFSACYKMLPILNELGSEEFFGRFMADAVAGLPYRGVHDPDWSYSGPYCTKDIDRAKFYVTRKMLPPSPTEEDITEEVEVLVEEFSEGVLSTLPKKTQTRALKELRKVLKDQEKLLNKAFIAEVEKCAAIKLKEKTADLRKLLREREAEAAEALVQLRAQAASTRAIFTKDEYRKIRGCLVSDKQPESERRKFDDAMTLFTRLKRACNG